MTIKDFGIRLGKIRTTKSLSAYELSLMLGKDASYIHKVENAKINISIKAMLEICVCLKIEPKELFE